MNPFNNIMKQPKGLSFADIFKNPRMQQAGPGASPMQFNQPLSGQGGDAYGLTMPGTPGTQPLGLPPVGGATQQSNPYQDLLNLIHGTDSKRGVNPWLALIQSGRGIFGRGVNKR